MKTLSLLIILALGVSSWTGCASTQQSTPENVVYCPKCETVWIESTDFTDAYGWSTTKTKVSRCPDCESAVSHFFRTGVLAHSCATCGADIVHCTRKPPVK